MYLERKRRREEELTHDLRESQKEDETERFIRSKGTSIGDQDEMSLTGLKSREMIDAMNLKKGVTFEDEEEVGEKKFIPIRYTKEERDATRKVSGRKGRESKSESKRKSIADTLPKDLNEMENHVFDWTAFEQPDAKLHKKVEGAVYNYIS